MAIQEMALMRTTRTVWMIGVLVLAGPVHGGEKQAKQILDRAIKAHGGVKGLTRAAQLKRKDTGVSGFASPVKFSAQMVRSLPDKVRLTAEFGENKTIVVLNGDRGWRSDG